MKTSAFLLLPVAMMIYSARAFASEQDEAGVLWGVKASFDLNIPGKWHTPAGSISMYDPGYGFTLGGVCNIDLSKGFYLEPGLSFFYDTYKADFITTNADGNVSRLGPTVSKAGIRVPVMVGYWFSIPDRFDLTVFTGPEVSYGFSGKVKLGDDHIVEDWNDNLYGNEGMQRRFDAAWKVGLGAPINSLFVSIDAAIGITDLIPGAPSCRDNRASVSLTYYF